jgi:hypothetical protein
MRLRDLTNARPMFMLRRQLRSASELFSGGVQKQERSEVKTRRGAKKGRHCIGEIDGKNHSQTGLCVKVRWGLRQSALGSASKCARGTGDHETHSNPNEIQGHERACEQGLAHDILRCQHGAEDEADQNRVGPKRQ